MHLIEKMVESQVDAISLDSPEAGVDLPRVAELVNDEVIIFGNISPTGHILNSTPAAVEKEVMQLLKSMEPYSNFVLSTGCDLPQETPFENISALLDTGREYLISE